MGCTNSKVASVAAVSSTRDLSGMDVPSNRKPIIKPKREAPSKPKAQPMAPIERTVARPKSSFAMAKPVVKTDDMNAAARPSSAVNSMTKPIAKANDNNAEPGPTRCVHSTSRRALKLSELSEQEKADVVRWRGFVYQGIPPPVLIALMVQEGLRGELFRLVLEPLNIVRLLTKAERDAISKFRRCLEPDGDGDGNVVLPPAPATVIHNMRMDLINPRLIPIIFDGYKPASCDARMNEVEAAAVRRYRAMLGRGMSRFEVARLTDREKADPRVVFLVFSNVPTRPVSVPAGHDTPAASTPNTACNENSMIGTITSISYIGVEPPPDIKGPVIKDGHCFGLRQACDDSNPTWSVHPDWDTPWHVCERRYSNHPEIVVRGTKHAYDEIERLILAGHEHERVHFDDKLRRSSSKQRSSELLFWSGHGLFSVRMLLP
ncbi:hypothetical protein SEMRO_564_G167430.1 [Seminavis robusta]|uniref:Uncharacterized protein n=1 Tax=Seminavis robusta TaxID=568900 RepID=A0A9N8E1V1_9STRA|nr:hypothetical protein SEMRO_564_G167430.1 [Seminavis robusta]|eukprot:Sro564_g167430.1 n/a (433) ;mRNA; r:41945-43243